MHVCGGFFVLWQQHKKHEERLNHVHYKNHHKEFQLIEVGVVDFKSYTFQQKHETNNVHKAKKTIWRRFAPSWTSSPSSLLGNAKLLHQNMQLLFLVCVECKKDIERKKIRIN
jgi:hypothetical protein